MDAEGRSTFINETALSLLTSMGWDSPRSPALPAELRNLCVQALEGQEQSMVLQTLGAEASGSEGSAMTCALRAFPLEPAEGTRLPTHVLVLMERIVSQHRVDLEQARSAYHLSNREVEVLDLLGRGHSNKQIAALLFLSEHTVKDHLKHLMKKVGATSRGEILARLR